MLIQCFTGLRTAESLACKALHRPAQSYSSYNGCFHTCNNRNSIISPNHSALIAGTLQGVFQATKCSTGSGGCGPRGGVTSRSCDPGGGVTSRSSSSTSLKGWWLSGLFILSSSSTARRRLSPAWPTNICCAHAHTHTHTHYRHHFDPESIWSKPLPGTHWWGKTNTGPKPRPANHLTG